MLLFFFFFFFFSFFLYYYYIIISDKKWFVCVASSFLLRSGFGYRAFRSNTYSWTAARAAGHRVQRESYAAYRHGRGSTPSKCRVTYKRRAERCKRNSKVWWDEWFKERGERVDLWYFWRRAVGAVSSAFQAYFIRRNENMMMDEDPSEAIEEMKVSAHNASKISIKRGRHVQNLCPRLECVKCPLQFSYSLPRQWSRRPQTYLSCGYCFWDSIKVQLVAPTAVELFNKMMNIEDNLTRRASWPPVYTLCAKHSNWVNARRC